MHFDANEISWNDLEAWQRGGLLELLYLDTEWAHYAWVYLPVKIQRAIAAQGRAAQDGIATLLEARAMSCTFQLRGI